MKTILFVDDDLEMHQIMKFIFDPKKYLLIMICEGQPIIDLALELPDLYLLDKSLSGMDGLDICRFLKSGESTRHIPVIMLSASFDIKTTAQQAGADDALEKPFSKKALLEIVNKYLHVED
jgi:CheY-like chemotaxis protein